MIEVKGLRQERLAGEMCFEGHHWVMMGNPQMLK